MAASRVIYGNLFYLHDICQWPDGKPPPFPGTKHSQINLHKLLWVMGIKFKHAQPKKKARDVPIAMVKWIKFDGKCCVERGNSGGKLAHGSVYRIYWRSIFYT